MNKIICQKCGSEYARISNFDAGICDSCRTKNELKIYQALPKVFQTFGIICIGMFLPLVIVPMIGGMEGGYYILSRRKTMLRATPFALLMLNLGNTLLMIIFFSLSTYFKQKYTRLKENHSELLEKDI